ncbi:MAG TPA: hypothetical protein VGE30_00735 [Candidatus Saccharimonadales bacterium]
MNQKIKKAVLAVPLVVALTACTQVEPDAIGLQYSSGAIEGKEFDKVVEPGTVANNINDEVKQLPTSQRSFIVRKSEKADVNSVISVAAKSGEEDLGGLLVDFEVSTAFKLNTRTDDIEDFDGGTARKFYEEICRHYDCELEDGKTPDGWRDLLREKFYPALESAFKDEARSFLADDLVNNTNGALTSLQSAVGKKFLEYLVGQTGGEYFCGPSFDRADESTGCPPVELLIISADYNNPEVRKSREAKKIASDQAAAQETLSKPLGDPNYLEYLRIQAYERCVEEGNIICSMGGSTPPVAITPQSD